MNEFFDKEGKPITPERWGSLFKNMEYRRIGLWGSWNSEIAVSTVWIGSSSITLPTSLHPSNIFETLISTPNESYIFKTYDTKEEAIDGHKLAIESVLGTPLPDDFEVAVESIPLHYVHYT